MTDTPPREAPYEIDDRVQIRLEDDDAESPLEGTVCRVVHVFVDDPIEDDTEAETEPDRQMDRAAYRLEEVETGDPLPIVLRHRDLRPVEDA